MRFFTTAPLGFGLAYAALTCSAPTMLESTLPAGIQAPATTGFEDPSIRLSKGGKAICVHGFVSVQTNITNYHKLNPAAPANQSDATQAILSILTAQHPPMVASSNGTTTNLSQTFRIHATLCEPLNATADRIQFLTHGLGFDSSYWHFTPDYSFVDAAASNNQATFLYDRLGVGQSQKVDPVNTAQGPVEAEVANTLVTQLREGKLLGKRFTRVIGVGHSYGSLITQSITAHHPSTFDAIVLTGFSLNQTGAAPFLASLNLAVASSNQPYRFSDLDPGYLVASNTIGTQTAFFHFPGANPSIATQSEERKGTITYGELLSQGLLVAPAPQFTGAVAIVNGNEDLPFCFGNCSSPADQGRAVLLLYPQSKNTSTSHIVRDTGHALFLHYSASSTFDWIQDFVARDSQ